MPVAITHVSTVLMSLAFASLASVLVVAGGLLGVGKGRFIWRAASWFSLLVSAGGLYNGQWLFIVPLLLGVVVMYGAPRMNRWYDGMAYCLPLLLWFSAGRALAQVTDPTAAIVTTMSTGISGWSGYCGTIGGSFVTVLMGILGIFVVVGFIWRLAAK